MTRHNTTLWRWLALIFVLSFGALGYLGWQIYLSAPPIPKAVVTADGQILFTGEQIQYGQQAWMSAGGQQFLNGGTIPAGAASNGQLITYQFLKTGRYLVLCINRVHFLNDWMFGFVNVVGGD